MTYHKGTIYFGKRITRKTMRKRFYSAIGIAILYGLLAGGAFAAHAVLAAEDGQVRMEKNKPSEVMLLAQIDNERLNKAIDAMNSTIDLTVPELVKKATPKASKATVTMYTSRVQETDDTPCISATGDDICILHKAGKNICAANDYKFGTKLTIEGLGTCEVLDRMNSRFNGQNKVDWYNGMETAEAIRFGVKNLNMTIEN